MKANIIFMTIAEAISYRLQAFQAVGEMYKQYESQKPNPLYYQRHTGVYL